MPVCVSLPWAASGRAIPKSVTFTSPWPFRSTFCGLTSRWTKPCWCATSSPWATAIASSTARAGGQRPLAGDELLQVLAGDVLEDDERPALVLAPVDHGDDVRVGEPGDELRLPPEAGDDVGVGSEPFVQDLDGDDSVQDPVVRAVHARHAAGADELFELVVVRDRRRRPSMSFAPPAQPSAENGRERLFPVPSAPP